MIKCPIKRKAAKRKWDDANKERNRNYKKAYRLKKKQRKPEQRCFIPWCENVHFAKKLCKTHYRRKQYLNEKEAVV